jgi:hypothetical protein
MAEDLCEQNTVYGFLEQFPVDRFADFIGWRSCMHERYLL